MSERVPSLRNIDLEQHGVPTEEQYISRYCELTDRYRIDQITFYKAYTLWRVAAIYQGILKRVEDGTAASSDANTNIEIIIEFANSALEFIKIKKGVRMDISVANSLNFEPAQLPQSAQSLRPKLGSFWMRS